MSTKAFVSKQTLVMRAMAWESTCQELLPVMRENCEMSKAIREKLDRLVEELKNNG